VATVNNSSSNEKPAQVNLQVKTELFKLVRKADTKMFESIAPALYPELVRQSWYCLFDFNKSREERWEHHKVVRNILNIYGNGDPMAVMALTDSLSNSKFKIEDMNDAFSKLGEKKRLVVPIMTGGIIPGAFVCDYLKKRDMLIDVAFAGYYRERYLQPNYYKPKEVHIDGWDAQLLKKHHWDSVLVVDDVMETGGTIDAVTNALGRFGINEIDTFLFTKLRKTE